jgi:hypothetical protein
MSNSKAELRIRKFMEFKPTVIGSFQVGVPGTELSALVVVSRHMDARYWVHVSGQLLPFQVAPQDFDTPFDAMEFAMQLQISAVEVLLGRIREVVA